MPEINATAARTNGVTPVINGIAPQASGINPKGTMGKSGLDFTAQSVWTEEKEKILLGPYDYLVSCPGKDVRKQLIYAFNVWLQVPEDVLEVISNVVAMLHTASLLVDDVEDNSILRRGVPVAHSIFGVAQTINTANYVYFQALAELTKLNNPDILKIYTEEALNLHRGQGMDLFWRDNLRCPTTEDYLEMVSNKTGGLFRLAIKLMQASSASNEDYVPLVNYIGLIFQVRDDYMNLQSSRYHSNKGFCEDLTEGKFSFPIIHSIRADPNNLQLLNILKQRTENEDVKKYAVTYMEEKTGTFAYTRMVLAELDQKARQLLEAHGGNEHLSRILDKMRVDEEEAA
ncbi:isoprenoid synthase domain-containing protein [Sphaerosporella brunnea]|uniref:Isoprenoid synthase domain-containing protein n=1 Tax=Sphaerosporella brunnea TaxID=1250544 RepID=A0A5J5ETE0_9PEZI|nr:isoprenoid synthase domain-containing protein [Sphaerosporella brunnea]